MRDSPARLDARRPTGHCLDLLQHVPGRSGHDRGEEGLVVGKRRQHQALDSRQPRAQFAADLDAVAIWKPDVEHRHIGTERDTSGRRLGSGSRLTDDLDVAVGFEHAPQAASDDLVIVYQEHS